jgi:hypothetical protein
MDAATVVLLVTWIMPWEWKPTDPLDRKAWDNNEVRNGTREKP